MDQDLGRGAGLSSPVFDVDAYVYLSKHKDNMLVLQGPADFSDLFFMPDQVKGGLAVQFVVAEQSGRIRNMGVLFKTAQGMTVTHCEDFFVHGIRPRSSLLQA